MKIITHKILERINSVDKGPFVSLYMPTHRKHPDNAQDPIRFKNLLKELESSLDQKYDSEQAAEIMQPFHDILENPKFWNNTYDGLGILSAPGFVEILDLPVKVKEQVVVADSFHTKPIRHYLQSVDYFHVLGVSLHEIKLFIGNRHFLTEMKLKEDMPKTIEDALGDELTDSHLTAGAYGGTGEGATHMYHGHGSKKDEVDLDAERFFRVIADKVYELYSEPSGLPLILAALPEHHNLFHKVSKNEFLLEKGVEINPLQISTDKLKEMAWNVMEPALAKRIADLKETFGQAKVYGKGGDKVEDVAKAAFEGRVDTLLLEEDKVIGGKISEKDGSVTKGEIDNPEIDDLLDDIGELVVNRGGVVKVISGEDMPSDTGLAAIYRY